MGSLAQEACDAVGITDRTYRNWKKLGDTDSQASVTATSYAGHGTYRYDRASKSVYAVGLGLTVDKDNHSAALSYSGTFGSKGQSATHYRCTTTTASSLFRPR